MLVATPGQTTAYSTLHNNTSSSSGGSGTTVAATTTSTKKSSTTLNSTNTVSGTPKSLSNNNNNNNNNSSNHSATTVTTKNSINSNTLTKVYNYHHQNPKVENSVSNSKVSNQIKMTATSSREIISSSVATIAATTTSTTTTTHSLKDENSTNNNTNANTTNITTTKQQSFIQTLKDSVQKALISTTGKSGNSSNSTNNTSIAHKFLADNKLTNNYNNSTTSIQNVTSSSSSTSHNANKIVSTTTTSSSTNSSNSVAASQSQSSSSVSLVRSKYFSCSLSKLHTVAPTVLHRYPEERQQASSTDSLQKEMCHFKPIRIVPITPWKSGSKSRGNSLRFPKANLATKKTEFILKSNCDVNNRRKNKQQQLQLQQNRTQYDKINVNKEDADDGDGGGGNNEQENKEFHGIYKPKPSLICLSNTVATANHPSAFVCLVAQMKSLVNLQSKRQLSPFEATAKGDDVTEPIKELYVRKRPTRKSLPANKQQLQPLEQSNELLPKSRTTRLSSNAAKNKRTSNASTNLTQPSAKSNNISKLSTVAITKAKSRRKLGGAKSKTINMVALAKTNTRAKGKLQNSKSMPAVVSNHIQMPAASGKTTRKRKLKPVKPAAEETPSPSKSTSLRSLAPRARKSSRLTQNLKTSTSSKLFKIPTTIINQNSPQTITLKTTQNRRMNSKAVATISPPLTRARLKYLAEQGKTIATNINAEVVAKKRRI